MRYYIYTDGSCKVSAKKVGSSFVVMTDTRFINFGAESLMSVYAFEAELNAVIIALENIDEMIDLTSKDSLRLYIDSSKSIVLCKAIMNGTIVEDMKVPLYGKLKDVLTNVIKTGVNIEFCKITAHQDTFNANKFVDRLAKLAIMYLPVKRVR